MTNKLFTLSCICLLGLGLPFLNAVPPDPLSSNQDLTISVNNRILARINGKTITTYDVMKKMDMGFYHYFPEYASSVAARYQYYQVNWKYVLAELINKELVLADAQENKIEVSGGDVRQELEFIFGPNIIANLDKAGMSFDEAMKIVQGDLVLRRTLGARVNSKVIRLVTPIKVRKAYEEFIQDPNNARLTTWRYQVITTRDRTPQKAEELANKAYRILIEEAVPIDQLVDTMKEKKLLGRKAKVTVSDEIQNNEKELSPSYQRILFDMETGMYSQPSSHKSRADNTTVYRIFYVKDKVPGGMPTFKEMENTLKDNMLNDLLDQETKLYIERLKQHFHVRDADLEAMIPSDYQPFILHE
jgi:hypothetical protein